jgi:hypothetical protein
MIVHFSLVSESLCAMNLLLKEKCSIMTDHGKIIASFGSEKHAFNSEYELLVWILEQIRDYAEINIIWLKDHAEREEYDKTV